MPVTALRGLPPVVSGNPPGAPTQVTSTAKDSGATVAFLAPASIGSSAIVSYTVTPYISGVAQSPTTVPVGSLSSVSGAYNGDTTTYLRTTVSGLTNSTAYTFTVKASNSNGTGVESSHSGANTPLSKLVFGDDFNGPAGAAPDPEWWVYSRAGYLAQSETEWYLPSQCVTDGNGNLALSCIYSPVTGGGGPQNGNATVTQHWTSGACQNNTKSFAPSVDGNTLTIESRFQVCSAIGTPYSTKGMWPGLVWCEGTDYQTQWKTDPTQSTWNATGKMEIDICEIGSNGQTSGPSGGSSSSFLYNLDGGTGFIPSGGTGNAFGFDASAAFHVYSITWKGTSSVATRAVNWYIDSPYVAGTGPSGGTHLSNNVTGSSAIAQQIYPLFLNIYLQVLNTSTTNPGIGTQTCLVDYVRVYDEAL